MISPLSIATIWTEGVDARSGVDSDKGGAEVNDTRDAVGDRDLAVGRDVTSASVSDGADEDGAVVIVSVKDVGEGVSVAAAVDTPGSCVPPDGRTVCAITAVGLNVPTSGMASVSVRREKSNRAAALARQTSKNNPTMISQTAQGVPLRRGGTSETGCEAPATKVGLLDD
jgi:hypothetical protein